jgi:predicted PurR-regulated permease PerM
MTTPPSASFVQRTLVVLALASLFIGAGLLAWVAADVLLILFAGVLVGILLRGLSGWTSERTGLSYIWALAVVCLALGLVGLGLTVFLAASVSQQFSELFDQLPQALDQLRTRIEANPLGQRILGSAPEAGGGAEAVSQVAGAALVAVGALGNGVLIAFVGLFLAADPATYRRGLIRLVPVSRRERAGDVLDEVGDVLLRWLAGRALLMAIIGVLTWGGLLMLGVPLALALAVIAAALSFIPNIGPILSAIPAMLLAATEAPVMALYVGALYLGLQTLESYTLEPYIVRKTADLPAALVIGFQLLMGTLLGVIGLALATPLLAMLTILVERLYVEGTLGDRPRGHRAPD